MSVASVVAGVGCVLLLACTPNRDVGGEESTSGTTTTAGAGQCGDPGTNSSPSADGCRCDPGFMWAHPDDPSDFSCEPVVGTPDGCDNEHNVVIDGACACEQGYSWCSGDPYDYSCCADAPGGSSSSG